MENAAKALEIAAGVLLAVIIMSLIAYFFVQISSWPKTQDEMETAEQLSKFNLEYEVYQKSAMYGVDVISCLNKSRSNNEKYAEGGSFLVGSSYNSPYYIDVYVHLESNLKESLEVYYMSNNKNLERFEGTNDSQKKGITMGNAGFKFKSDYTSFATTTPLDPKTNDLTDPSRFMVKSGGENVNLDSIGLSQNYYSLRGSDGKLYELLNQSGNNMQQIITNTTGKNYDIWTKAIWKTALYDFKTKRFKCDYIGYSEETGRVNRNYFSELPTNNSPSNPE